MSGEKPEYRLYTRLLVKKFKASTDELPSSLFTLGRVTKTLAETETVNLMSKYFGGLKLPPDFLQNLVNKFRDDPKTAQMFGSSPSMDDMLVKYPAVALSPIAMYR